MRLNGKPIPPVLPAPVISGRGYRLFYALCFLLIIISIGTYGYHLMEGWSYIDALYMTVITLATVGYGETHPLSTAGRIFTIFLIFSSVGTMGYAIASLTKFIVEGEFNQLLRGRRMSSQIANMKDHIILCGAGPTGMYIAEELSKTNTPFVLIERNPETLKHVMNMIGDMPYILGDAAHDDTLLQAGIERAKGLIAVLGEDKDNVFIVLSARSLNSKLRIVARVIEEENTEKFRKAGADEIVSPNAIGGLRMASIMIRPSVVSFLDQMLRVSNQVLRVEELRVDDMPDMKGRTLEQTNMARKTGLLVLAVKSADGQYQFNPGAHYVLQGGDVLIVMGAREQLQALKTNE
ncbi:MAG: potassium channel protein [Desulfobacteraceae bacterium]|nr:MAG: potassium channel protein [Desulfobacteraceae bacterium]